MMAQKVKKANEMLQDQDGYEQDKRMRNYAFFMLIYM